jgi:hypothetical protein
MVKFSAGTVLGANADAAAVAATIERAQAHPSHAEATANLLTAAPLGQSGPAKPMSAREEKYEAKRARTAGRARPSQSSQGRREGARQGRPRAAQQ